MGYSEFQIVYSVDSDPTRNPQFPLLSRVPSAADQDYVCITIEPGDVATECDPIPRLVTALGQLMAVSATKHLVPALLHSVEASKSDRIAQHKRLWKQIPSPLPESATRHSADDEVDAGDSSVFVGWSFMEPTALGLAVLGSFGKVSRASYSRGSFTAYSDGGWMTFLATPDRAKTLTEVDAVDLMRQHLVLDPTEGAAGTHQGGIPGGRMILAAGAKGLITVRHWPGPPEPAIQIIGQSHVVQPIVEQLP